MTIVEKILSSVSGSVRYSSEWKFVKADCVVFKTLKSLTPDITTGFSVEKVQKVFNTALDK